MCAAVAEKICRPIRTSFGSLGDISSAERSRSAKCQKRMRVRIGFFFTSTGVSILTMHGCDRQRRGCRRGRFSNMADPKDVTEREAYVIAQALYEFIRLEQSKPRDLRRWSDEQHAIAILHARFDNELATLVQSDEAAGRQSPDCGRKASIGG